MSKKLMQQTESSDSAKIDTRSDFDSIEPVDLNSLLERVLARVTPAWDTRDYVAVNPLFGYRNEEFLKVIQKIEKLRGALLLPDRSYLREKYNTGEIQDRDLSYALMLYQAQTGSHELVHFEFNQLVAFIESKNDNDNSINKVNCLTDLYDREFQVSETKRVTNEISKWMSAYFDEGQSIWKIPKNPLGLFATWKKLKRLEESSFGTNKGAAGIIEGLPNDPQKAIEKLWGILSKKVRLQEEQVEIYFERLLATVPGWAAFVKKIDFEGELFARKSKATDPTGLIDLLAIRLAYDVAFIEEPLDFNELAGINLEPEIIETDLLINYLWLLADEIAIRRKISERINFESLEGEAQRPLAQMAFCIDVRSEVIRRHIERSSRKIETIGFAGFFGVPIALKKLGFESPDHQCPVLLKPVVEVTEKSDHPEDLATKRKGTFLKKYGMKNSMQSSYSAFSLAETFGFSYAGKMLLNSLGISKPNINLEDFDNNFELDTEKISIDEKVQLAYGALFNMGLTERFGRYVIFFGHGGESSNNPYQGALDCGACAGHNGRYNSEFLASLLNNLEVREQLKVRGIQIPEDTQFYSGWHNTTTDELNIRNESNSEDFLEIKKTISKAIVECRIERSQHLIIKKGKNSVSVEKELKVRACDWSEARPEWALARNHSFIIGRRELTRQVNLEGRSFLHDYDPSTDPDLKKLELIMTAPMIVTNWINMQYYTSTIDPENFGTGNKVLNNVVGTIGCVQGNESDLLTGLSEQSVRLNGRYFHEPVRLQVFIEASTSAIDQIIEKHQMVSDLVLNGWLNVVSMNPAQKNFKLRLKNRWIDIKEALWN